MAGQKGMMTMLSVFALAAIPKCPLCLLALGSGLFASTSSNASWMMTYQASLAPLTGAALAITVGALAVRARKRHGLGPAGLALAAAVALYAGKFHFNEQVLVYLGMALLFVAMVWNGWPRRDAACSQYSSQVSL